MAISKAFLSLFVEYLQTASGLSPMAMIGHQQIRCSRFDVDLCIRHSSHLMRWLRSMGSPSEPNRATKESLLATFGITEVTDFDLCGSPDERVDLSQPIPDRFRNRFRSLLEIGTLEHVVNPYQALLNFDDMLTDGGVSIHFSPVKIRHNHGYYAISPQLLYDFYLGDGRYELVTAHLVSYYLGYDSFLSPIITTPYSLAHDLAPHRRLGLFRSMGRKLRRASIFLSDGTYIGLVVRKKSETRHLGALVQQQYRSGPGAP